MVFEDDDGREPGLFFSVTGIPQFNKNEVKSRNIRFHFPMLSYQKKQMSFGHRPIYVVVSNKDYLKLI